MSTNISFLHKGSKANITGKSGEFRMLTLYQAASGNEGSISLYRVETANGSDDTLIIHEASNNALRLTPKAKEYFPKWIEENLMKGFDDAESFYAMKYAMERDAEQEARE